MGPQENKSNEEPLKLETYRIKNHNFCIIMNKYYEMSNRTQTNHSYNPEVQSKKIQKNRNYEQALSRKTASRLPKSLLRNKLEIMFHWSRLIII